MSDSIFKRLICPGCCELRSSPPVDAGDKCKCGQRFVSFEAVREWKRIYDMTGSVVAEARIQRAKGGHHLAVYGAIGKVLIDRDEFDSHYELLLKS